MKFYRSIEPAAETMVDLYEPSMAERGIRIRVSGESGVTVNGDEGSPSADRPRRYR
ncbi:MAG: hypothetical protein ABSE96_22795 [Terracidiphilus sp.]|jgi:hypothetical protein